MAGNDYFLKVDGIPGESQDKTHANEIELESFSWGASNTGSIGSATGGAGAGKVQFQEFSFVQKTNKASSLLLQRTADGGHIPSALLTIRRAGKAVSEFLKIKLSDVIVSSFTQSADGGDYPVEEVGLKFAKIEFEYHPQQADGSLGAAFKSGWDLKKNTKA
jgi:type VI secretion system secreted protein Hcp